VRERITWQKNLKCYTISQTVLLISNRLSFFSFCEIIKQIQYCTVRICLLVAERSSQVWRSSWCTHTRAAAMYDAALAVADHVYSTVCTAHSTRRPSCSCCQRTYDLVSDKYILHTKYKSNLSNLF
jgi:hypothetical protein